MIITLYRGFFFKDQWLSKTKVIFNCNIVSEAMWLSCPNKSDKPSIFFHFFLHLKQVICNGVKVENQRRNKIKIFLKYFIRHIIIPSLMIYKYVFFLPHLIAQLTTSTTFRDTDIANIVNYFSDGLPSIFWN